MGRGNSSVLWVENQFAKLSLKGIVYLFSFRQSTLAPIKPEDVDFSLTLCFCQLKWGRGKVFMNVYVLAGSLTGFLLFGSIIAFLLRRLAPNLHPLARGVLAVIIVLLGDALISPYGMENQSGVIGGVFAWSRFQLQFPAALISVAVVFVWVAMFDPRKSSSDK